MGRLEPLSRERMNDEQREVHDQIASRRARVPEGQSVYRAPPSDADALGGPYEPWLRNPELARRLVALGGTLRFQTSLPARLTELAILVIGREWSAQFEWWAHEPFALRAGVAPETVEAIKQRRTPPFEKADEQAVYAFARELLENRRVGDDAYRALRDQVGEAGVVELVALLGYYTLVSMTLDVFEVDLPGGAAAPLAE